MRRVIFGVVLAALLAAPLAAQAQRDRVVRTIDQNFDPSGFEAVVFELNVGEMKVVGTEDDRIRAEVRIRCTRGRERSKCEKRAEGIELTTSERRGRLFLEVAGTGIWRSRDLQVEVGLSIPKSMPLELEVGAGDAELEDLAGSLVFEFGAGEATLINLSGDVTVDMGVGEISLTMPESAVGEVMLDNGIGETELRHSEGRNAVEGILGGTDVHWKSGPGPHVVKIDLNIGEITVRLR